MKSDNFLVVDFDSTFVELEALEEIAKEALKENPEKEKIQNKIQEITQKGMRGEISFFDSLRSRLELFSSSREDVEAIAQKMKDSVTESFLKNKKFFQKNGEQIFIVSGGFKECIFPVSDEFGIPRKNVLANDIIFDEEGKVAGVNEDNLASKTQGKVRQLEALKLAGTVFAIGDGWTDFEMKKENQADFFLAFTENVRRESVVKLADEEAKNFDEVLEFINKPI